jgi:3-oxoadipate enol-lactonase
MLIPLKGRRTYCDIVGADNSPVVCLCHSLSADSVIWADQVPPLLANGYRVLRIDMRGHGGSEPTPNDYSMSMLAGDVADVLDALGLSSVHFIGLSVGGMIGQVMALEHRPRLKSMIVCDTMAAPRDDGAEVYAQRLADVAKANSLEPIADATMERWFMPGFKVRRPGRWMEIRNTIAATTPAGYRGCIAAMLNYNVVDQLSSIRLPTLVACGTHDVRSPPSVNKRIAALIPGARYEDIPEARHASVVDNAEFFNKLMLSWLAARG